jgi:hypothetical protein
MGFRLAPTAIDDGYRLDPHDSVGSTNALALQHAAAGDPGRKAGVAAGGAHGLRQMATSRQPFCW